MSEDPWDDLAIPKDKTLISGRRVDETNKWDFYWGRDSDRRCLLLLRHAIPSAPRSRLPRLKGVEVFVEPGISGVKPSLVLRLLDSTLRDIFYRLCNDIIASASTAASETEAVAMTVARTWRWHHLLRGGGGGLLTAEEQKGLIGELLILERYGLALLPARNAVEGWLGPMGAPQDFVVGRTGVESKARATTTANEVVINSEYQLDDADLRALFLHISALDAATSDDDEGFTVTAVACRIRDRLAASDELVVDRYNALLAAAGFRYDDDYSGTRWTGGERSIYRVEGAFPRLTKANLPSGISDVRYVLSVNECGAFLASPEALEAALTGESHDP